MGTSLKQRNRVKYLQFVGLSCNNRTGGEEERGKMKCTCREGCIDGFPAG